MTLHANRDRQSDSNSQCDDLGQRAEVELAQHSLRPDALLDPDAALERDERLRVRRARPIEVRAGLATQVEKMLEAGRADERGLRPLALEQGVGGDRRPVRAALD